MLWSHCECKINQPRKTRWIPKTPKTKDSFCVCINFALVRLRVRERERERHRERERERERHRQRDTDRDTERERERDRQTDRERERVIICAGVGINDLCVYTCVCVCVCVCVCLYACVRVCMPVRVSLPTAGLCGDNWKRESMYLTNGDTVTITLTSARTPGDGMDATVSLLATSICSGGCPLCTVALYSQTQLGNTGLYSQAILLCVSALAHFMHGCGRARARARACVCVCVCVCMCVCTRTHTHTHSVYTHMHRVHAHSLHRIVRRNRQSRC